MRQRRGRNGRPITLGIRRRADLSLRELAAMAGVTIGRIARIQSKIDSIPVDEALEEIVSTL